MTMDKNRLILIIVFMSIKVLYAYKPVQLSR